MPSSHWLVRLNTVFVVPVKRIVISMCLAVVEGRKRRGKSGVYRGRWRRAQRDAGNIEFLAHGCSAAHDVFVRRRTIRNDTGGATIVKRST